MTTIQSLLPELLYKILSTGCSEADIFLSPLHTLSHTSLFARAWKEPSQDLLIRSSECRHLVPILSSSEERPSTRGRTVELLDFRPEYAEMLLEDLERQGIRVVGLNVLHGPGLDLGSLKMMLMDNLKRLELWAPTHGHLSLPPKINLTLEHLTLLAPFPPPLHFLAPLVASAPHLTRLDLIWAAHFSKDFPLHLEAPFLALAPQLRHLSLRAPLLPSPPTPSQGPGTKPLCLSSFLSNCTSLRSFKLDETHPTNLAAFLALLPPSAPLLVLSTSLIGLAGARNETNVLQILKVLEMPILGGLKRWRLDLKGWSDLGGVKSWMEGCEKWGVEPRGMERFYTD